MKHIYLFTLLLLSSITLQAKINGTVKDRAGEPIPGANVFWLNGTGGVTTNANGQFTIPRQEKSQHLVVSFIGFENDTITVGKRQTELNIVLREGVELAEVSIVSRKMGTMKLRSSVLNEDMISSEELCRAACCNLGESFITNPSVDVSYSDAATGAKQIKLLGLSGTYVQMLTENIPNFRGAAAPYGLGYVPGPWMNSIQVSKGTSSVKNGYEALTGQINVEFKKPNAEDADWVSGNLFASTTNRYEANADASVKLSDKWSTMLLAHYENETKAHDANNDGFVDIPRVEQYHLFNRWTYMSDNYVFISGIKALSEDRKGGQANHGMGEMPDEALYEVNVRTNRYEAFAKNAFIFNQEKNTNLALILSGTLHNQDAVYGRKLYDVDQQNAYASLMFETEFTRMHAFSAGLSYNFDGFDQRYRLTNNVADGRVSGYDRESVAGAYAQYTLNWNDKLTFMAGLRGDHSNLHGFFVTPRTHLKYAPNEYVNFRLSAGKGYRTNHVLAENNYLMASSRKMSIADNLDQEEAWNYGASASTYIPLLGKTLNVNAEFYYTDFQRQVVIDMDSNPHEVAFVNLDGRSYSKVLQVEASYPFFTGFTLTAAYRVTDAKTTYGGELLEKPLTSKYKGLLTASYQTALGIWQFDATLQLNGGGRMPTPYQLADNTSSWENRYKGFEQVSAQVTRYFRNWSIYVGGENLTNFKQKNPIVDAANPWGQRFDSTMIWGPVHGVKGYVGLRVNLPRL
ncbi:TonB-dependent receptor [Bacteroides sp.]|uniref:TonB-dependent receptor n=1 Tax=Bacteroides sp. TaxID=29523 RepID=UPI001B7620A4|nr:TonB-dependent receptor [Bacteroides sp.]MBP6065676.1 TonB-dependent receptor [Bacteroides sp.]MBP6068031.1 TonB-dependent receptor [Bacteroides sp.]MBP6936844.1 TonB-dependent receptor [Bacteroides sp.]MBP8622287.1 TonB-dependent receptor [Bacteroides sp.]MBP9506905.1 TonB-dependent receptor [Bacteroides sp.]